MAHPTQDPATTQGTSRTGKASAKTREAVEETKAAGQDLMNEGKAQAERGRRHVYESLESTAGHLAQAGQELHGEDEDWAGGLLDRAAGALSSAAGHLRDNKTGELVREVQNFGTRNPALFLGLSAAAGLMLARVGKTAFDREDFSAAERPQPSPQSNGLSQEA